MRKLVPVIGALAVVLAIPTLVSAAPLCFGPNGFLTRFVIPIPTFVRGQARPVVGTMRFLDTAAALAGTTITNMEGTAGALSFTVANTSVSSGSASASPGTSFIINVAFPMHNLRLAVGQSGNGFFDAAPTTFTVVDCRTVPDVP